MQLTTDQITKMAEFIAGYNGGDADDYIDAEIAVTRDAFDRYDGSVWVEASGRVDAPDFGVPARYFESVQDFKGQTRSQLWVMDFGDFRAVYKL